MAQVDHVAGTPTVLDAWSRGRELTIHGWVCDVTDGLVHNLEVSRSLPD